MSQENVLIPNGQKVELNGKVYTIGKLGISQAFKLSQLITTQILSSQEKLKQLEDKTNTTSSNAQDLITIIGLLDEKSVIELFQIILKDNTLKEVDLDKAIEIIAIVCEHNEFSGVKKNVQRIIKVVIRMMTQEKTT